MVLSHPHQPLNDLINIGTVFVLLWMSVKLLYKAGICIEVWLILIPTFPLCGSSHSDWAVIAVMDGGPRAEEDLIRGGEALSCKNVLQLVTGTKCTDN